MFMVFISIAWLSTGCKEPMWRLIESGTEKGLRSIWGSTDSDIWAVGIDGTVLHWNGSTWHRYEFEQGFWKDLFSVWGAASYDVWAAGEFGAILHWDGNSWTQYDDNMNTGRYYYGIWGVSSNDVWAIGSENDESIVAHWDGYSWSDIESPYLEFLRGISGMDSEFVVSVGWVNSMHNNGPAVIRWDGATWREESYPECGSCDLACWFEGVWCSDYDDIWAVGSNFCRETSGHIMHWNGPSNEWEFVGIGHVTELHDLWGESEDNVWAVGTSILHWNGKSWSAESSESTNYLKAVWGTGGDIWAVGSGGTIVRRRL